MQENTHIDWKGFAAHRGDPLAVKGLAKAITEFLQMKMVIGRKFTVPDAILGPSGAPVISVYDNSASVDAGYEDLFDLVDMRDSSSKTFELIDVTNGITFEQTKDGDKIKIRSIASAKAAVSYLRYTGGLGFLDDWFRFNEYYKMEQIVNTVKAKYYNTMAQVHYDLFTALSSGVNQAFATDDVTTINNACATVLDAIKDKGYAVGDNPVFRILCSVSLKARISKALAAAFVLPNANNNQIVYNIDKVVATPRIVGTSYYVVLPGVKLQRGIWSDLNAESERDALRRAEDIGWEGKFNAVIADSAQVRRCALS